MLATAYSAWLKTGDGWMFTNNIDDVLDHQDDFIVCETQEENDNIEERIAELTGLYTYRNHTKVEVSDVPIITSLTEESQRIVKSGVRCISRISTFYYKSEYIAKKRIGYFEEPGFCVVQNDDDRELIYDIDLWDKCKASAAKRAKNQHENPVVNCYTFSSIASKLACNMGILGFKCIRVEEFLIWILAHDQFAGRRATNKEIKWIAKQWSKNPAKYKKYYKRWVSEIVLEKLEARFRKVVKFPEL